MEKTRTLRGYVGNYPVIGESLFNSRYVLFSGENQGILIQTEGGTDPYEYLEYRYDWEMHSFTESKAGDLWLPPNDEGFPRLMKLRAEKCKSIDAPYIVMFTNESAGICLTPTKSSDQYSETWVPCYNTDYWEPYDG